ncbi:MAG: Fis family transcriptional regulator [Porticoccus sp.]|nr:Fis family transcriptional regulator [Porticoccus sp.]
MKKSDKKTENSIRVALTDACEIALEEIDGFKWITHYVSYNNFPGSLSIICVFEDTESLVTANKSGEDRILIDLIQEKLASQKIVIKNIKSTVSFNTVENIKSH